MTTSTKRLGWIVAIAGGVIASLITFPAAVPWMIAGWLLYSTVLIAHGRPGWLPLAVCASIVLVKNVDWPSAIYLLAGAMLAVGIWRGAGSRKQPSVSSNRLGVAVSMIALWGAWLALSWMWWTSAHSSEMPQLQGERPVVCVGDSLTSFGYPDELAKLLTIPVINQGTDGITTSDALKALPELIAANPQIVVIELGGHDFLKGKTRAATKANLQKIVDACHDIGAEVVVMEVPRGFIIDPFGGLEREFTRENDLELVSDGAIRNLVLWSPYAPPGLWLDAAQHLSDDGLHPNARGNRYMAECVTEALVRLYGEKIRTTP